MTDRVNIFGEIRAGVGGDGQLGGCHGLGVPGGQFLLGRGKRGVAFLLAVW